MRQVTTRRAWQEIQLVPCRIRQIQKGFECGIVTTFVEESGWNYKRLNEFLVGAAQLADH
jgi:hypothetical protein